MASWHHCDVFFLWSSALLHVIQTLVNNIVLIQKQANYLQSLFSISLLLKWYFLSHTNWLTHQTQMSSIGVFRMNRTNMVLNGVSCQPSLFHILSSYATLIFEKNHPSFISSLRSRLAIASRSDIPCPGGFESCASETFNEWSNAWFGVQGGSHKTTQIAISAINCRIILSPLRNLICILPTSAVACDLNGIWFWVGVFVWSASFCLPKTDTCPLRHCGVEKTHLLWICANSPQSIFTETNNTGFPCKDDKQFNDNRIDCMYIMCNIWLWCTI